MTDDNDPYSVAGFLHHHAVHPWVWRLFEEFAQLRIKQGYERYGARSIFEDIRWHTDAENSDAEYKLNNNWHPFYARIFNLKHNFLYFRLRRSRADALVAADCKGF